MAKRNARQEITIAPLKPRIARMVEAATVRTHSDLGDGQGVLVAGGLILTAAHCLDIEWGAKGKNSKKSTFNEVVLSMVYNETASIVSVTTAMGTNLTGDLLAFEPFADFAVVTSIDRDADPEMAQEWSAFCLSTLPLKLIEPPRSNPGGPHNWFNAHILSHEGHLIDARGCYKRGDSRLHLETLQPIVGGTSGGPIVDDAGRLLGLVSNGTTLYRTAHQCKWWLGSHSVPAVCLPPWIRFRQASRSER